MMTKLVAGCCALLFMELVSGDCFAKPRDDQKLETPGATITAANETKTDAVGREKEDTSISQTESGPPAENKLGLSLLKNIALDQQALWTSPARLRLGDASWLVPMAALTTASLAGDTGMSKALTYSASFQSKSTSFSNYGLAAFGGLTGGLYLWGKITADDHKREAGLLSGEAAVDAVLVTTALQYGFGRQRPGDGNGGGGFWHSGTSFPSDHSTAAWAVASVIAHEYPGPFTKFFVYGLASAVSLSRVTGRDHFPTDVLIGAGIGWLTGRYVYRTHHDPDLAGDAWAPSSDPKQALTDVPTSSAASTFVPLDSWVYPAFDRLAAMGYVTSAIQGLKPWTRMECARLTNELGDSLLDTTREGHQADEQAVQLDEALKREFAYELGVENGEKNESARIDSVYTRVMSLSGPILTDGYDLGGQTISYDFGRPFRRGTNELVGASGSATLGPFTIYARVEYQHAPSAPPLPNDVLQYVVSGNNQIPFQPGTPLAPMNRADLLEGYISYNLGGWQVTAGKQALSWGPGEGGSLLLSDNAEPMGMVRLTRVIPTELPGVLQKLGKFRTEWFIADTHGGVYVPHPLLYGQKFSFAVTPYLEIGYGRTAQLGRGTDAIGGNPFTTLNFFQSFFGLTTARLGSVPGSNQSSLNINFDVPGLKHSLSLYGDLYAKIVAIYIADPPLGSYRAGVYIPRLPHASRMDFRFESTSTESPVFDAPFGGRLNYWNFGYRDGYTNFGQLMGNTVGRQGRIFQGWTTLHISGLHQVQFSFLHHQVDPHFVEGGGVWNDYTVNYEIHMRSGFYTKTMLQFEHIQHFPVLFEGSEGNVTASMELGFTFSSAKP